MKTNEIVEALRSADWSGQSIGNKLLIGAAIQQLEHLEALLHTETKLKEIDRLVNVQIDRTLYFDGTKAKQLFEEMQLKRAAPPEDKPAREPLVLPERMSPEDVRWHLRQSDHDDGPTGRVEHAEYIGAKMWNDCLDTLAYQIANTGKAVTGPTQALKDLMARKMPK